MELKKCSHLCLGIQEDSDKFEQTQAWTSQWNVEADIYDDFINDFKF